LSSYREKNTHKIATLLISISVLLLSWFGRSIQIFLSESLGKENLIYFVLFFTAVVIFIIKKFFDFNLKLLPVALIILFSTIYFFKPDTSELIHFSEYGAFALSLLFIVNEKNSSKKILICLGFSFLLGLTDEILQEINPTRIFDLRDIAFNVLGALIALLAFKEK